MVTFPYYIKFFKTKLNPEEISGRLGKIVDQQRERRLFSNKYFGDLGKNGFKIYKDSVFFNVTLLKIIASYETFNGSTKVKVKFTLTEFVWTFYILISVSLIGLLILTVIKVDEFWLKFTPLLMIVCSYFIIMIPFNFISKDAENILGEILEGKMKGSS